ncbi:MAG: GreA/GreB family elongation factor [Acidobacteriota bacterium]
MSSNAASAKIPADIQKKLKAGDLDAVEEIWIERVEKTPAELDFFTAVAQGVTKADTAETAHMLLQMLDDELSSKQLWPIRIEFLRRVGRQIYSNSDLHELIVDTLREMYGDKSHFEALFEKVGLDKAKEDIPKTWQKADRLENLMAFDVGAIVAMKEKGAGRISEVNMALESFKVDFEGGLELRVGFGGAAKLLRPLPANHILRRKLEDPKALEKLRDEDPSELLRLVLEGEGRSMSGAEIKKTLQGIVSPKKWNSYWNQARKNPQVLVDPKNKRAYMWAASTDDAQGAVWQAFLRASVRDQLTFLRRDAERDETLKKRMSTTLWQRGKDVAAKDPGLACEIYYYLEKSGITPPSNAPWRPEALVQKHEDLRPVLGNIQDRPMRESAYALVRKLRADWPQVYAQVLWQESDARALDSLSEALNGVEPELFEAFFDQLVSQPHKAPGAFTWLIERAADRPEWLSRNPGRLMQQLFFALTHGDFAPYRAARLVPMTESGGTLPRLLDHLDADQAVSAIEAVKKTPGLEDYQREPLITAIQLRFPKLHEEKEEALYALEGSINAKRAELKQLAEEEIPENRKAIESARELGDLRENFEYHAARRRHEYLSVRAGKLDEDLRRVRLIDPSAIRGDEAAIGATVTFRSAKDGSECAYSILGPWESDPERRILSNESDLAKKILGRKIGETVPLPEGSCEIVSVMGWSEA